MRGLFFVAALVRAIVAGAQTGPPDESLSLARERERTARLELEAARSKKLYVVVDLGESTVSVRLSGVVLASYPIQSVDVGMPITNYRSHARENELSELYSCRPLVAEELRPITPGAPPAPGETEEKEVDDSKARVELACEPPLAVHFSSAAASSLRDRLRLPSDARIDRRVRVVVPESEAPRLLASLPRDLLLIFSRVPRKKT